MSPVPVEVRDFYIEWQHKMVTSEDACRLKGTEAIEATVRFSIKGNTQEVLLMEA